MAGDKADSFQMINSVQKLLVQKKVLVDKLLLCLRDISIVADGAYDLILLNYAAMEDIGKLS